MRDRKRDRDVSDALYRLLWLEDVYRSEGSVDFADALKNAASWIVYGVFNDWLPPQLLPEAPTTESEGD